jgi:hypothetical protein
LFGFTSKAILVALALGDEFDTELRDPGDVSAWPREARHEARIDWIGSRREHNGNRFGGRHRRADSDIAAAHEEDCDFAADEVGRKRREPFELTICPASFNRNVSPLDKTHLAEGAAKYCHAIRKLCRRYAVQHPDQWHRGLLRARRRRPSRGRGADEGDELAPLHRSIFHSITASAMARSLSGTARPKVLAVGRLMTSSNRVDCTTGRSAGFSPLRMRPV